MNTPFDTTASPQALRQLISESVQDDPASGHFRCRRDIFTDAALFEHEMKVIFEQNWVFLAHESQVPNPNDYFVSSIGRQPVIITRDKTGKLGAVINACAHRGAELCRRKQGNKGTFTCPFHGWTFSNTGKLLKVKDGQADNYPEGFNVDGSHDLTRVPSFANYRGFLFGSMNPDAGSIEAHLGGSKAVLDQIVDQTPGELEVLRGSSSYVYDGNWKLQIENGADGYHVSAVHWNYVATVGRRDRSDDNIRTVDANAWSKSVGGFYAFEHGHLLLWTRLLNPEVRPVYGRREELKARLGEEVADAIVNQTRNLCIYPNLYVMDQVSTQIRVVRPISVDKTEVTIYCFGPRDESEQDRNTRIRQYEDFFNVSGMGTPDDLEEFRACQSGFKGVAAQWNDLSRGAPRWVNGADDNAARIGLKPILSGVRIEDEGLFVQQHRYWSETMLRTLPADQKVITLKPMEVLE
ncbi:Rieske 2Fe-2S domain-containing protein [Caballeronia novacaledonica]|uniref:Rieske 2Fe-2S domain-containing protein n=1 Tax=Caballeronia novacaledonica TaxID=1544861 RepID=UPI003857E05F